jgi:hypothetical protein
MRAGILARPKRRKTRARWRRPELLLVAWLTEEMDFARFYEGKLNAAAMACRPANAKARLAAVALQSCEPPF